MKTGAEPRGKVRPQCFPGGFHLMEIQCWVGRPALGDTLGIKNVIHWTHYHALAGNCNTLCKWPQLCSYAYCDFLKTRLRREVRLRTARKHWVERSLFSLRLPSYPICVIGEMLEKTWLCRHTLLPHKRSPLPIKHRPVLDCSRSAEAQLIFTKLDSLDCECPGRYNMQARK